MIKEIQLHHFDDFHKGQMVGVLQTAIGAISSIREFEYGATSEEKAELKKAQEIIEKMVFTYGEKEEE